MVKLIILIIGAILITLIWKGPDYLKEIRKEKEFKLFTMVLPADCQFKEIRIGNRYKITKEQKEEKEETK